MSPRPAPGLTQRQRAFARYYVTSRNASESARKAGYAEPTNVIGSRLLKTPSVSTEVARLSQMHAASVGRMANDAIQAAEKLNPGQAIDPSAIAGQVLQEMSEQIAGQLARHWLTSTLIRSVKMDMGDLPVKKSVFKSDGKVLTVETYQRNSAGVAAGVKLLLDEVDRRERVEAGRTIDHEGRADDRSIGARMIEKAFGKPGKPDEPDDLEVEPDPEPPA